MDSIAILCSVEKMGVTNLMNLPKDLATARTEITEKNL
jgi:hypothetical protein